MSDPREQLNASKTADTGDLPPEWGWLRDVRPRLEELGLTVSVFDAEGRLLHEAPPVGRFMTLVRSGGPSNPLGELIHDHLEGRSEPKTADCLPGYACLPVSVHRRRRRVGVVAVSLVFADMPDTEEFRRFCQVRELDAELLLRLARQEGRFHHGQADSVVLMVRTLVEQAMECHTAVSELAELSNNLTNTYEELNLVYKIAAGMTVTEKAGDYLSGMADDLMEVMGVQSVAMRCFRPDQPLVSEHISVGAELTSPRVEESLWHELLRRFEGRAEALIDNQANSGTAGSLTSLAHERRVLQLAAQPMVHNNRLVGALLAMNKSDGEFSSGDLKLMKSIADEAAVFLENSFLYEDLQQLLMGMLRALTSSIDAKDPYTCGHSERVAIIASRVAESAGLSEAMVKRVHLAGLLHDIGKIGVPEGVLTKPGRLTKPEFAIMRKHPEIGAKILAGIKQVQDVVAGVLSHHERFDGKGYPHGLAGADVPLFGRIVGLADCFDAMTSNRTYRRALPLEVTLTEIRRYAGTQFDPAMVEAFFRLDLPGLLKVTRSAEPAATLENVVMSPVGTAAQRGAAE